MYQVSLDIGTEVLKAKGKTLLDAFNALTFKEHPKVLKSVLTVTKGDKTIQKVFNMKITRLFARNPITRNIWAKLIDSGL